MTNGKWKKGHVPWNKGKKLSDELKKRISETLRGRPSEKKGIKLSEKTKEKISETLKGNIPWNKGKKCKQLSGRNHWNWNYHHSTKQRKYLKIHNWINEKLGKPNYCENCKESNKKRYDWANKDHLYRKNIEDWIRLCRSCHLNFDIKYNNLGKKYERIKQP